MPTSKPHHVPPRPPAVYRGQRIQSEHKTAGEPLDTADPTEVTVERNGKIKALASTARGRSHSPTGFNWGYGGSGPASLAHAIIADHLGYPQTADLYYQEFKRDHVSGWGETWSITTTEITAWLDALIDSRRVPA